MKFNLKDAATAICFNDFCEIGCVDYLNAYKASKLDTGNAVIIYNLKTYQCAIYNCGKNKSTQL